MNNYFVEILPNIYWTYIFIKQDNIISKNLIQIQSDIKKFAKLKKISKIIRLDNDTSFWNINNEYNIEIKKKILEMNSKKLLDYVNSKVLELKQEYAQNNKVLIISNNNIETAIALFLILFKSIADMGFEHSIQSLQSKIHTPLKFSTKLNFFLKYFSIN